MKHAIIALCVAATTIPVAAQAGEVWLTMDTSKSYTLDKPVSKIIITNPAIADVQVLSATELMMFGRMSGQTNIVFIGQDGKRLDDIRVRVGNDRAGLVTLQNGGTRYTFSCTDRCEQTPTYGDGPLLGMQGLIQQAQIRASGAAGALNTQAVSVSPSSGPAGESSAGPAPDSDT